MEDYIFLIIAVALSIYSAVTKKKKKEGAVNPLIDGPEEPKNSFIDRFLEEDFLPDPPAEVVKPVKLVRPAMEREPFLTTELSGSGGLFHPGFKHSLPKRKETGLKNSVKKAPIEVLDTADETDETSGYLEDFSLRKAFVYSEIMTRKY